MIKVVFMYQRNGEATADKAFWGEEEISFLLKFLGKILELF